MLEDASSKNFMVSNFIIKMVDARPIMEQYHKLLWMMWHFVQYNMKMDETISVTVIIQISSFLERVQTHFETQGRANFGLTW